ncbi:MAG: T9SS type A sorting domain-containing protein [Bacteroidota bacterium]
MKKLHYFLALLIITPMYAQTVSTWQDGTPDDGIAIDSNGNVYASNFTGDTVFKFDTDGNATAFVNGLDTPNGLAFDSTDRLYICDWNANKILRYNSNGTFDSEITITANPSGIIKAWDNDDMIYTRFTGNTINRITPEGVITEVSSDPLLNGPVGLAYDETGRLFVGNYNNREVYEVLSNGDLVYIATVGATGNLGFITYGQGVLWGTAFGEHKIYTIHPEGVDDTTVYAGSTAGNTDGALSEATFTQPNGILFDPDGTTLYITDFGSKNLRLISDVTLGTQDISGKDFGLTLHPNPSKDTLHITARVQEATNYSIVVYNALGNQVHSEKVTAQGAILSVQVDVKAWASGVYWVELSNGKVTATQQLLR